MKLHGFSSSSAAYRVRAALYLKGLAFEEVGHDLIAGEQTAPEYLAMNPQGLVPALETDEGKVLTQSMAICEYLEDVCPQPPLLPADPVLRAKVRAVALAVACEIHPLQNRMTLLRLRDFGLDKAQVSAWTHQIIGRGLDACEIMLSSEMGPFCFGATPSLADIFVVPQMHNARRFGMTPTWPKLLAVEEACLGLDAFARARPQPAP
jgi:maleylpyruvate isomerase